jgi:type IV pilus assembly protein PilO
MSAMTDLARLPTKQKVMMFAFLGVIAGLLYYQFVYKGLKEDLEIAESQNAAKKGTNAKLEKDIPAFEALKTRMTVLQRTIEENQKALPTEAELPAFFETLNRKVLESGIEVVRSRQGKEELVESFVRVPVEYEIVGSYNQIKKFFASLVPKKKRPGEAVEPTPGGEDVEERERIVSIENLSLTNPVVANREIRLTAKFTASTYRMEERTEFVVPPLAKGAAPSPAKAGVERMKGGL